MYVLNRYDWINVRIALLALFGLFFYTVVCPMTMGAMDMRDMQMSDVMQSAEEDNSAMPCDQCEREKEVIVGIPSPQTEVVLSASIPATFLVYWQLPEPLNPVSKYVPLFANGPPIPTKTLVGTVIFRT